MKHNRTIQTLGWPLAAVFILALAFSACSTGQGEYCATHQIVEKDCPWCNRKVKKPWKSDIFPEKCPKCRWSVDTNFWNSCPWCTQKLV